MIALWIVLGFGVALALIGVLASVFDWISGEHDD